MGTCHTTRTRAYGLYDAILTTEAGTFEGSGLTASLAEYRARLKARTCTGCGARVAEGEAAVSARACGAVLCADCREARYQSAPTWERED